MNESIRTAIFVAVAAVIGLITWVSWKLTGVPEFSEPERVAMEGKLLFPDFTNPLAATSLEIVKYDEQTASEDSFQVAQIEGEWSIPSHSNYPADAEDQLAEAASSMIGLEVVDMASNDPDTHEMYGVVDPSSKPASTAAEDVGVRVVMRDKDDRMLMALIIGKQVPDRDELRYVRAVDEKAVDKNAVYTVAVKTDKLSSKFEDWIEEDLLKLSSWDVREIHIQDYSVLESGGRAQISRGAQMTLKYDDTGDTKWSLVKDFVFDPDTEKLVPGKMAEDEELDTDKLDDLSSSLDNLEIIDVRRKPSGLSADLRAAGTLVNDLQTVLSLQSKGYYLVEVPVEGKIYMDVISNQGELRVSTKDGVVYVLRFGEIAGGTAETPKEKQEEKTDKEASEDSKGAKDTEDSETAGLNRYLFVMADFDEELIPKPELEALPEKEEKPAGEKEKQQSTEEETGDASTKENEKKTNGDSAEGKEEKAGDANADDDPDIEKERERIIKENKRKEEEYKEKIDQGRKKHKELNDRFANWYYVISDEVYQKIHLGRNQIVKKKEKKEEQKDGEKNGEEADTHPGDAGQQPQEPAGPLGEFKRLKQEGPGSGE